MNSSDSIYSAIVRSFKSNPERICIVDGGGRRSSRMDFLRTAFGTLERIRALGLPSGAAVAINLPNSMEYLACEFGVWMSGCTAVPLNPLYPKERVEYIIEDCSAALVIDGAELENILSIAAAASPSDISTLSETFDPDALAAIFYTSGSTGKPKGVVHTFASLCARVESWNDISSVSSDDIFGTGAPMAFIAFTFILPYLREGATVALFTRETMLDIQKLQQAIVSYGVTCAFFNPSLLKNIDTDSLPSLGTVFTGSERVCAISPSKDLRIINFYGMTESCVPALYFELDRQYDNTPIGRPAAGVEAKLSSDGEILLKGTFASGYWKDPEKTSRTFEGGWLHTGDLGRILPDGNFLCTGRKDWMCKINGQRVEAEEVASVILSVGGVTQAAVKPFTDENSRSYLVGYYVSESLSEDELRSVLSDRLPVYMVPSCLVRMDSLPKNANLKVDMASLRSPREFSFGESRKVEMPVTPLQKTLCSAFETALGVAPIGIDDDFFSMGGDSIRVVNLQKDCAALKLSASAVYRLRTVRDIAGELSRESGDHSVQEMDDYPLSAQQTGIYAGSMSRRGEVAYNNAFMYRLSDDLDDQRLAAACTAALKAHPGLFAAISVDAEGNPVQRKGNPEDFELKAESLTQEQLEDLRKNFVQPFDLLSDRLFRMRLVRSGSSLWLFADFHHIVFDGTSNAVIMSDIEAAYGGAVIEAETFTAFDAALSEQRERLTPYMDECRKWNLDSFSAVEHTSLPEGDIQSGTPSFGRFETVAGVSAEALSRDAARLGVTLNVLSTAAFGHALGSCTNSLEAAFATVYNGRKDYRCNRTAAMMVTTLPILLKWSKATTVGAFLKDAGAAVSGAMAHDLFSFGELCAKTCFDSRVIFTFQDELLERKTFCGKPCELTTLIDNATGEPLTVQLYKKGNELVIRSEYRSDMFSQAFIERLSGCFSAVLDSLSSSDADSLLSSVKLTDALQTRRLLDISSGPSRDWDLSQTVVGMIRSQAIERPSQKAVVAEDGFLTYAQLDSMSDSLAARLIEMGVQPDSFVAVMTPRVTTFPVAFLACFKCGAAYVPMDYEYPADRLQYMLEDSQSKVLLTTRSVYEDKTGLDVPQVIFLDEFDFGAHPSEPVDRSTPSGLAYMIYTSGTTGKPKGVMIEHHGLTNLVHWYSELGKIGPGTRIEEHASFSFDGSVMDLIPVLASGGELHIIPSAIRKDIEALYRYFNENSIEGGLLTTRLAMLVLGSYDLNLRYLVAGGEKLTGNFSGKTRLINAYGPSEFTVASSYYVLENGDVPENIPIGRAVPNTISAIIDPLGRLLPQGMEGELALCGVQLARGYWNRPDITQARFTASSFLEGQTMYHTGDLARWSEDGELIYRGRIDTQVKLRGFRIELGEVESVLAKFPGVRSATAAVKEIGTAQHLCAYYCSDAPISEDELRSFVSQDLTSYMVPTAFVHLDAMPMTPNGKVDIKSLPIPQIRSEEIVAPEGDEEKAVFDIVAEALGTDGFGVTSNLISMGMTSLGAIGISLKIEKRLSLRIPSSVMLEKPSIRQWLSQKEAAEDVLEPFAVQKDYPLTDNQTGIYIDWERDRSSTAYNVPMLLRLEGVDAAAAEDALKAFADSHPYIKTRLHLVDGQVLQERRDGDKVDVSVTTLDKEPDKEFFRGQVKAFDLLGGPLYRFNLYSFRSTVWILSDVHHIIFDGGSENLYLRSLACHLKGLKLENEKFTAYDWSLSCAAWKTSDAFAEAGEYFKTLLEGTLPVSLGSTAAASGNGVGHIFTTIERASVRDCCRREGVTENAFFLTAVTQALHRLTREKSISILTVSSGRSQSALQNSVGMFVQTLPVVSREENCSVSDSLQAMQRQVVDTIKRDRYPLIRMVEDLGLKTNMLVAYQGDVLDSDALKAEPLAQDSSKMPLSIVITPSVDNISIDFEYDRTVYAGQDVAIFSEAVAAFATNIAAADRDALIGSVSCVNSSQEDALVALGSGETIPVDPDATLISLFKAAVKENPENKAVVDEKGSLTYAELDSLSDSLAAELVSRGVCKDSFVALMLPRRKEFCISYLAVFKSGGAYVPVDSEYPSDRILYMLEDSQAKVLVTTHELFGSVSGFDEANVIFIDTFDFNVKAPECDRSCPDGVAYMIYTSGTTGKPKGVMIEQKALVNLVSWTSRLVDAVPGSRFAAYPSFSFDASIMDLMTAPATGGELHIIAEQLRRDPQALAAYYNDNSIENVCMPTQAGMLLLQTQKTCLKKMMVGGEKLTGTFSGDTILYNGYGPSEFTVSSSYYELHAGDIPENIPIGRAVPNTISAIVDPYGNLLPKGAAGEIALVGVQLSRGYWNRPDVTASRFVDCPFVSGNRMYRTGDLARWNEDGQLLFMGRIDTQVKLRGFRIELGEVESVLRSFPGVLSSVAAVKETAGTQHLCAYFTASGEIDKDALKAHMASKLTSYMVPDALVQMDSFPLTPNGKVDLKALPEPEISASASGGTFEEPQTEAEIVIAGAFSEVLGSQVRVGRNDSFFRLGGTSLQVMKVIVRLSESSLKATYGDVFKYPTPSTLAAFLDGVASGASSSAVSEPPAAQVSAQSPKDALSGALSHNTISDIGSISQLYDHELGDVLLLGSTGYLGIHILHELLVGSDSHITCVIRPKKGVTCEGRLKSYLMYYFDNTFASEFESRLTVIEGDMSDEGVLESLASVKAETVINCAANVKHFASGDEIEKINVRGAENLVKWCLEKGARLVQTSTHSISGLSSGAPHTMLESELDFGQILMTKYQQSKLESERMILSATERGLKAKIMRLGNLMPRYSDGEFQINLENNGFMARMRAYYLLGCMASSHLHIPVEFAPIDQTASAILTLARTPDRMTVFHPFNNHQIYFDDIAAIMRSCGLNISIVDDIEFSHRLEEALADDAISPRLTTLVAYSSHNDYASNTVSQDFTMNVLNAMNWRWSVTSERYLREVFEKLDSMMYFNK